jgi:hypothetical protein
VLHGADAECRCTQTCAPSMRRTVRAFTWGLVSCLEPVHNALNQLPDWLLHVPCTHHSGKTNRMPGFHRLIHMKLPHVHLPPSALSCKT